MGVRIDISVLAGKKAVATAAAKKPAAGGKDDQAVGDGEDFGRVLAKAQPKKKVAAAEQVEAKEAAPVAKGGKKQAAKVKQKDDSEEEGSAAVQTECAQKARPQVEGDEVASFEEDGVLAVEAADAFGGDEGDAGEGEPEQVAAIVGPAQAVVDPAAVTVVTQAAVVPQPVAEMPVTAETDAVKSAPVEKVGVPTKQAPLAAEVVRPTTKVREQELVRGNEVRPEDVPVGKAEDGSEGDAPAPPVSRDEVTTMKPVQGVETKTAVRAAAPAKRDDLGGQPDEAEVRGEGKALKAPEPAGAVVQFNEVFQSVVDRVAPAAPERATEKLVSPVDAALSGVLNDGGGAKAAEVKPVHVAQPAPATPEARFVEENHPKIVTAVKTQMLPGGGAMQLRLDPPVLGPLRLEVRMEDGAMTASFVTANEQATSMLTHSLGQLKHALEGAGISVDKLQVRQGSAESFTDNPDQRQQGADGQASARQEQQRREMLNRMWQKVAGGDPLDLVA